MSPIYEKLLDSAAYMPKIPWKQGERDAFKTTLRIVNDLTIPIVVVPPAGDFDHEEQKIIVPSDHIKAFGKRLFDSRGKRPIFVDAVHLDNDRHKVDSFTHPLSSLIERARLAGSIAWPLTSLGRSDDYQEAVAKSHLRHHMPIAIQLSMSDIQSAFLKEKLESLCNQISCERSDAVLILDMGPIFVPDEMQFVEHLIPILNDLPDLYGWKKIVLCCTSLGNLQKVKANQEKTVRRIEWTIYKKLVERRNDLYRLPVFSDYGVEYFKDLTPRNAIPSAKMNYTRDEDYFFVKGLNVKAAGYQAIFAVADKISECQGFMGAAFSPGDACIAQLATRERLPGVAPTWKWAVFDHHLAMVGLPVARLLGLSVEIVDLPVSPATQLSLLSLLQESESP